MPKVIDSRISSGDGVITYASTDSTSTTSTETAVATSTSIQTITGDNLSNGQGVYAGTSGTTNITMNFRSLVSGAGIQLTSNAETITITNTGVTEYDINDLIGTLGVAKGGTGVTSLPVNHILVGNAAGPLQVVPLPDVAGKVLSWDGSGYTWIDSSSSGNTGTVTSVGLTAGSSKVTVSGSPITSSGNITVDVLEGNLSLNNIGGTLNVTKGGTGATSFAENSVVIGTSTGLGGTTVPSVIGSALTWSGTSYTWVKPGTVSSVGITPGSARLTVSGSPVTSSGNISVDVSESNIAINNLNGTLGTTKGGTGLTALGTANQYLRVNSAATGYEFATLPTSFGTVTSVGLTAASNRVNVTGATITGSGSFAVDVNEANLNLGVMGGTLPASKGGTGLTALGTVGQQLRVNTAGNALEYFTPTSTGTVTSVTVAGGSGVTVTNPTVTTSGTITVGIDPTVIPINNLNGTLAPNKGGTGLTALGNPGQSVRVNTAGNGLEYYTPSTGNSGTVTSVGLTANSNKLVVTGSPITVSGTIGIDLLESNLVLSNMGGTLTPAQGGTGLTTLGTAGQVLTVTSDGTGLGYSTITQNPGTVTSVAVTNGSNKISVSGAPVTSSGVFIVDVNEGNLNIANMVGTLATNRGGTGLTTLGSAGQQLRVKTDGTGLEYFTPVAGGNGTVTSVAVAAGSNKVSVSGSPVTTSGTITVDVSEANLSLSNIGGTVPTSKGGTGLTSIGIAGQLIRVNSTGDGLEYYTPSDGSGGLATVASTGQYSDLLNIPTFATVATTGAYADLSGTPALATVATSGAYSDLSGRPVLATVATSGSYNDLTNKPTITNGTVTSVAAAAGSSKITISGSPITTNGTITFDVQESSLNIANMTGTLGVGRGGTGLTSLGTAGQSIRVNTTGDGYEFYTPSSGSGGSGTVTSVALVAGSNKLVVNNSPITTSGTLVVDILEGNLNVSNMAGTLAITHGGTGLTTLGAAGQSLRVNTAGTGYEFYTPSSGGSGGANAASQYMFQITLNGGATITSTSQISNAPSTWSFAVASGVITVTHDVGRPPVNVVTYASSTTSGGAYKVRNMDVNSGNGALTLPDSGSLTPNTTQVQFTITGTTTGGIANGTVFVRLTF